MEFTIISLRSVGLCLMLCFNRHILIFASARYKKILCHIMSPSFASRFYSYSLIKHITNENILHISITQEVSYHEPQHVHAYTVQKVLTHTYTQYSPADHTVHK